MSRNPARLGFVLAIASACAATARADGPRATRNVVLVTTDGLRPQEVFGGAEESLLNKPDGGVVDVEATRRAFWRETTEARREALLPFLWSKVAREGQVYGNAAKGSPARVANGMNFSYPGYNELLTGVADPRIDSNAKRPNPNVTVLEWLDRKPAYRGRVAAVASWDVFPFILNRERSRLPINAGWEPVGGQAPTPEQATLNRLMRQTVWMWDDSRYDSFTFEVALDALRRGAPHVLYIGLGDTDEHAHAGRYDLYLQAARRVDEDLKLLWDELQARPESRGTTTLIVTTDHGRGDPPREWRDHGAKVKGSDAIWIAILGPDTPALGERSETGPVTQGQVAATVAALLGEDYRADMPAAAPPLVDAIGP